MGSIKISVSGLNGVGIPERIVCNYEDNHFSRKENEEE